MESNACVTRRFFSGAINVRPRGGRIHDASPTTSEALAFIEISPDIQTEFDTLLHPAQRVHRMETMRALRAVNDSLFIARLQSARGVAFTSCYKRATPLGSKSLNAHKPNGHVYRKISSTIPRPQRGPTFIEKYSACHPDPNGVEPGKPAEMFVRQAPHSQTPSEALEFIEISPDTDRIRHIVPSATAGASDGNNACFTRRERFAFHSRPAVGATPFFSPVL
jgi:hypothetical protein